jgi:prenyltransferase beta subunit
MTRIHLVFIAFVIGAGPITAGQLDDPGTPGTIEYLRKLQTQSGGFLAMTPTAANKGMPTLRSTSSAVRALHYLKGEIPDQDGAVKFIAGCFDAQSGGFSDAPGGKADVVTTAIGLMAVAELKMPVDQYRAPAVKFLTEKTGSSFEEIRIAAAGLESIGAKSSKNAEWLKEVLKSANNDGTFDKGAGQARATGGAVVTILRLGDMPKDKGMVLKALKDGQRFNGGFGKAEDENSSDLESTYRIMRCFMMLKGQPERLEGLRTFIAKCRNEDGGYGVGPGEPSSVSGTYYAATIRHWLGE